MSIVKFTLILMIFLVFPSQISVPMTLAEVGKNEATSALDYAEESLASAYQAVLKAEEAGANVSDLVSRLNAAANLLDNAEATYRLGDFDEVVHLSTLCSDVGKSVKNEAEEMYVEAYGPNVMNIWLTMTGSLVGAVAVGLGSFWSWRFFKRRYYKRILMMKPEAAPDES